MQYSAGDTLLDSLAGQRRHVLSDWRAMVLLRRATFDTPASRRRWASVPGTPADTHPLLRRMHQRGEIEPIRDLRHIYRVTTPYAATRQVDEDEPLLEAHPYAAVSHLSALAFHGLTYQTPKSIFVVAPSDGRAGMIPLDTDREDWEGIDLIRGRRVARVLGRPILWRGVGVSRFFGFETYRPRGYPVRVATPERTLLDGLLEPDACGGLDNVLGAWARARGTIDLDLLVGLVERFGVAVLRQRAGFVLDELGLVHPHIEGWRARAQRGGSSKLLGSESYAPTYDERWALSLNAPVGALREGDG